MVHEWALAEAIIDTAIELAKEKGASKIKKIIVRIGVLQSIEWEILRYALDIMKKELNVKIENIVFEEEDVRFKCGRCGYEWGIEDLDEMDEVREAIHFIPETVYAYIKCPNCGSPDFTIVSGRGVYIRRIEAIK